MRSVIDVAVVGAGPYGLSTAAHAIEAGLDVRVFGRPMAAWEHHMPQGMLLKSEPSASNLADPDRDYELATYCRQMGRPCAYGEPVPVETFVDYGKWFHRNAVKDALDCSEVAAVRAKGQAFAVEFRSGATVTARSVVLALGFLPFAYRPLPLAGLPAEVSTHSSEHHDLSRFKGQDVAVVGAGQSALETAALLHELGARPLVVARTETLQWNGTPELSRSRMERALAPQSGLGTGWRSWLWAEQPGKVRYLPLEMRRRIVKTTLGPAGAWWLKERFDGRVTLYTGHRVVAASHDGQVRLTLLDEAGALSTLHADHVIAATGYAVDVARVSVLDEPLRDALRVDGTAPKLTRTFETSIDNLYMVGLAAANTFGPAMRFVHGARFAARRVTKGLKGSAGRGRNSGDTRVGAGSPLHRLGA